MQSQADSNDKRNLSLGRSHQIPGVPVPVPSIGPECGMESDGGSNTTHIGPSLALRKTQLPGSKGSVMHPFWEQLCIFCSQITQEVPFQKPLVSADGSQSPCLALEAPLSWVTRWGLPAPGVAPVPAEPCGESTLSLQALLCWLPERQCLQGPCPRLQVCGGRPLCLDHTAPATLAQPCHLLPLSPPLPCICFISWFPPSVPAVGVPISNTSKLLPRLCKVESRTGRKPGW